MKFLIFNIAVAAALVYLFNGGDWDRQTLVKKFNSSPLAAALATPDSEPVSSIKKPASPTKLAKTAEPTAAKPVPTSQTKPAAAAPPSQNETPLPPEVAKRRAKVLAPIKDFTPIADPRGGAHMSPEDRRRSLILMAEDMELFAVEAVAQ